MLTLAFNQYCGNQLLQRIYNKSEHIWGYAGKIIIITRSLLNAAARNQYILSRYGADFPAKVKLITTRLKLFSIVSVGFSLGSLKSVAEKIFKNFLSNNKEGVTLNLLAFSIIAIDVVDSTATFINAALDFSGCTPIESLSNFGIPLAGAMSILGIISRIIQIAKSYGISRTINQIQKQFDDKDISKHGQPTRNLSKAMKPLRHLITTEIPSDIKDNLNELSSFIGSNNESMLSEGVTKRISSIHERLKKKFVIDGLGIFANTLTISALALFTFGSLGSAPFLLVASSFCIRLSSLAYQNN